MPTPETKRFENADERKLSSRSTLEIVHLNGCVAVRGTYEPGWRWSEDNDSAETSCQEKHLGFVVTGTIVFRMDDNTEIELQAGDVASIPPGHDAWVIGNTPCVFLDFRDKR